MRSPTFSQYSIRQTVGRAVIALLLVSLALSSSLATGTAQAACEDNFSDCEGTLNPLKESFSAANQLAWTLLQFAGVITPLVGLLLFTSSRTGTRTKQLGKTAIIGGAALLFLYFAKVPLFQLLDYIVNG